LYFAIFCPTRAIRLLAGVYPVGVRYSSKRSITAADCRSSQETFSLGDSPLSVSTTDDAVTSSSACGACRSNAVTAVPQ
jgi:hypothetical protein